VSPFCGSSPTEEVCPNIKNLWKIRTGRGAISESSNLIFQRPICEFSSTNEFATKAPHYPPLSPKKPFKKEETL
jgi:predicted metal-binding protein